MLQDGRFSQYTPVGGAMRPPMLAHLPLGQILRR